MTRRGKSVRRWRGAGSVGLLLALVLAVAGLATVAHAEDPAWARKLPHELMSPFCPGLTLASCPSPQAAELREWIVAQAQQGRSKKEVMDALYRRFGDVILQAPMARGFGLTAYLIPIAAFVAGGVVVAIFLRRQSRAAAEGAGAEAVPPPPIDPEIERQIDEELGRS